MELRALREDDLDLICRQREAMCRDAGRSEDALREMIPNFREWLRPRLGDGRYFGFLVCDEGRAVAGIGLMLLDWPPHPEHPDQDRRGYVLNVYVEPAYRRRGLARRLMQRAHEEFARRGVRFAVLHATEAGRPVYDRLGWRGTTEMALRIGG